MKVYGYTIISKEMVGFGMPWWDEYYEEEETKLVETRLFESESRRDEECKKSLDEIRYKYSSYSDPEFESFKFESEIEQ